MHNLNALYFSGALIYLKEDEDTARSGRNSLLKVFSQCIQIQLLLDKANSLRPLPSMVNLTLIALPFAAAYLHSEIPSDSSFKKPVQWISDSFGSLCQLAALIYTYVLYRSGYFTYAALTAAFLSLGYLKRFHLLPLKVNAALNAVMPWICSIALLSDKSYFLRVTVLINLSEKLSKKAHEIHTYFYPKPPHLPAPLTYAQFEDLVRQADISGNPRFKVDRHHVKLAPFPLSQERQFGKCLKLWDAFDWSEAALFASLKRSVEKDARWRDSEEFSNYLADKAKMKELMIAYSRRQLVTLINSIEKNEIRTGQLSNYAVLENYLGFITEKLQTQERNLQVQTLLSLAMEGGNYCGPGVAVQLEKNAVMLMDRKDETRLPLKQRILILLQQERLKITMAYHRLISEKNPILSRVTGGKEDVHSMNFTCNLLSDEFGLPDFHFSQDHLSEIGSLERFFYYKLLGIRPEDLWKSQKSIEGYSPKRVVEAILVPSLRILENSDYIEWARGWIERSGAAEEQKDAFLEKLSNGEYPFFQTEHNTVPTRLFLAAMLVDMGILTYTPIKL